MQHALYVTLVALCGRARIIGDLDTSTEKVNEYINRWSLDQKQQRSLLRLIHWALIRDGRADQAAKVSLMKFWAGRQKLTREWLDHYNYSPRTRVQE